MSRKYNGEGTIYPVYTKDKNGKNTKKIKHWVGQVSIGVDSTGRLKRKSVYGATREIVKNKIIQIQADINNLEYVDKNSITLKTIIDNLIEQEYKANKISDVTYIRKKNTAKLASRLDCINKPIQSITRNEINNDMLILNTYAQSTINKVYELIAIAYNEAVLDGILKNSPFYIKNNIIKPKSLKKTKKVDALTIDEQKAFLSELSKSYDIYNDVFYIAIYTGMRVGEILALQVSDINFKTRFINVKRTITKDLDDKPKLNDRTKTFAGEREIPIVDELFPILLKYQNKSGLLFTYDGKLIHPSIINSHFKRLCKNAGIRLTKVNSSKSNKNGTKIKINSSNVNTHMLRHTFATRCIESGMSAVVLAKILGHTDVQVTLNTYTDVFNKFKESEFEKINNYFKNL